MTAATKLRLTMTEVSASIKRQFEHEIPIWRLRRIVDSMQSAGLLDVQRMGLYPTIDGDDISKIADELRRLGWLPKSEAASC